jgi:ArsR family transcriptional regulator
MGITKTENFNEQQNTIAKLAKAIGHPARVAIVEFLLKAENCICGDIVNELPLAQPTVSQHLKELKNAGIIKGSIEGNSICYCIDENALLQLKSFFTSLEDHLNSRKNTCC